MVNKFDKKIVFCYYIFLQKKGAKMNKIVLKNFVLEQFNYENIEHLRMIDKFDMDREINKYIIMSDDSFSDIVDYYRQLQTI